MTLALDDAREARAGRKASIHAVDWDFADSARHAAYTHSLHPWPARFIPEIPARAIDLFTEPGDRVVDPFVGCGTTALEAMVAGRSFHVSDANELAVAITRAKCSPPVAAERELIERWIAQLSPQKPADDLLAGIPSIPNWRYWFSDEAACQLVYLFREIAALGVAENFLRVVASSIVTSVSYQESETRYRHIDRDVSAALVLGRFSWALRKALRQAALLDGSRRAQGTIVPIDARVAPVDASPEAALAVFSPPYPNSFDYHLYHRFRMFWLGFDPVAANRAAMYRRIAASSLPRSAPSTPRARAVGGLT